MYPANKTVERSLNFIAYVKRVPAVEPIVITVKVIEVVLDKLIEPYRS